MTQNPIRPEPSDDANALDYLAEAAHELSAPLFSILGLTRLLLDDRAPDEATRREFLGIVHLQAAQLARIVADLREFATLEGGAPVSLEMESVLPEQLIEEAVSRAKPAALQKHISLGVRIAHVLPAMRTDRGRANQVLDNLVANALKFTEQGGAVQVIAEPGQQRDFVRISILDNGPGISPENLSRVFDRFFRADPTATAGTGLGLHISKQLVEILGGSIGAHNSAEHGSTFWFELPAAMAAR